MFNIIQCGLGSMGSLMAQMVLEKKDMRLAGAVSRRADLRGADLGEYLGNDRAKGVKIYPDFASTTAQVTADLALTATGSFLRGEIPVIEAAVSAGLNVVSIAEEMAYPVAADKEATAYLDRIAREHNVTLLGTGINPGFVLDVLIITLTGICRRVDSIYAQRSNDLAAYGQMVMKTQGIGLTPQAFHTGVENGTVVGHIGFQQSITMIADVLGLKLDCIKEKREPIVAKKPRKGKYITVAPGMVAGCCHRAKGIYRDKVIIELVHPQQIQPEVEGNKTWDNIIIKGQPDINLRVEPEMDGRLGTAAIAVNMAPLVVAAEPGLKTMKDLPVPRLAALKP